MTRRSGGLFAGRGIALPGILVTVATFVACFALGIGAGWVTGQVPGWYRAWSADSEATASASPSESSAPDVTLPALEPITRGLDDADAAAGVVTTDIAEAGAGTFSTASDAAGASASPDAADGPTRSVRVDVEDGVSIDPEALVSFVMTTLNDNRGWGSAGRLQFVLTDGAADVTVVVASPATVAARCPDAHAGTDAAEAGDAARDASPSPDASAAVPCVAQGIVPVSIYDWTAGLDRYGDKRGASRAYLLNHGVGHVLGEPTATCSSGRAEVMVDQTDMPKACSVNAWPFPDAKKSA
ncbi:DUF3152 domain-containing protein [Demequina phytophila]|uniref:DUF3152 domain-containing protein n=1 Tax=Demequina phytophila TaxID=1638981 RepID=UPI000AA4881C|nr:DUF3152 domain-containing protein [Demequina phytophila]